MSGTGGGPSAPPEASARSKAAATAASEAATSGTTSGATTRAGRGSVARVRLETVVKIGQAAAHAGPRMAPTQAVRQPVGAGQSERMGQEMRWRVRRCACWRVRCLQL